MDHNLPIEVSFFCQYFCPNRGPAPWWSVERIQLEDSSASAPLGRSVYKARFQQQYLKVSVSHATGHAQYGGWGGGPRLCSRGPHVCSRSAHATQESQENRVLTHFDQWISRTLNQISMTKRKYRYKHETFRKFCVLTAYAGLYFERLSLKKHINYFKLGVNEHVILTMTFPKLLWFKFFPWLFRAWK